VARIHRGAPHFNELSSRCQVSPRLKGRWMARGTCDHGCSGPLESLRCHPFDGGLRWRLSRTARGWPVLDLCGGDNLTGWGLASAIPHSSFSPASSFCGNSAADQRSVSDDRSLTEVALSGRACDPFIRTTSRRTPRSQWPQDRSKGRRLRWHRSGRQLHRYRMPPPTPPDVPFRRTSRETVQTTACQ
jgi:hypothetical protein